MRLNAKDRGSLYAAAICAALVAVAFAMAHPARTVASDAPPADSVLRVCADPNNLPFTNKAGEGFENKIAELLAADLHQRLEYTWWRQTGRFFKNTLGAKRCDVVLGAPRGFPDALETAPYYTSTYVFVTRKDRKLALRSLDDPQ